jgi:predicted membrane channel-forming protein YqfA (hemolysin III family)
MPDVQPAPKTENDRILVLECAMEDVQKGQADWKQEWKDWKQERSTRDQWLVGAIISIAGVVAVVVVAYVH